MLRNRVSAYKRFPGSSSVNLVVINVSSRAGVEKLVVSLILLARFISAGLLALLMERAVLIQQHLVLFFFISPALLVESEFMCMCLSICIHI